MSPAQLANAHVLALVSALAFGCGDTGGSDDPGSTSGDGAVSGSGATSDGGSTGTGTGTDTGTGTGTGAGGDAGTGSGGDAATGTGTDGGTTSADASTVDPTTLAHFSFFVISQEAVVRLSKSPDGFGGDLRYGETGDGAGIRGADKICTELAEASMPGAGQKGWRAFLSASTGGASGPLHARDRIGAGPWYDRMGRLVGNGLDDLLGGIRPTMANSAIANDLPNETGTPNHNPGGGQVDNHDTLTGSDTSGRYVSGASTCSDWTSAPAKSSGGGGGGGGNGPSVGHSWPRNGDASSVGSGSWLAAHKAGGCAKGINTAAIASDGTNTVGSGGGYGGFYCFATLP